MSYTEFGEFMRIQRIKNHEIMGDVAELLGVRASFVSAVESGKRNVPKGWYDIISEHYKLSEEEKKELQKAIENSRTQVKINLISAKNYQREAALQFQRSFETLDEETAEGIIDMLNRRREIK